jgi:hypothetical protein
VKTWQKVQASAVIHNGATVDLTSSGVTTWCGRPGKRTDEMGLKWTEGTCCGCLEKIKAKFSTSASVGIVNDAEARLKELRGE